MEIKKGTLVRIKRTREEGMVDKALGTGMLNIRLKKDGSIIPVHVDDLEPLKGTTSPYRPKPGGQKGEKEASSSLPPPVPGKRKRGTNQGVEIGFDPSFDDEGNTKFYNAILINDTSYDLVYSIRMVLGNGETILNENGKLSSASFEKIGSLYYDELNEHPSIEMECHQLSTAGLGEKLEKQLKVKPKQFFNKFTSSSLLNKKLHLYLLFPSLEAEKTGKEDLEEYTKRKAVLRKEEVLENELYSINDSQELAHFEPDIDLHIEKLTDEHDKMSNSDILRLQLKHFEAYLEKAISLGVRRVFIIHGVGAGKLRNEIAARLLQNPDVTTFKNEFHPHYGFGATEVIFE
jgi:hypothetical protein